jgi:glycine cleavage system transcriptional repressor
MNNSIVITAIGPDKTGFVHTLTQSITDNSGNIIESRMIMLGSEFAVIMLVEGNWHAISKIEQDLKKLGHSNDIQLTTRKSIRAERIEKLLPYEIDLVCLDHPGIIHKISGFLSKKSISIGEVKSKQFHAPHTGAIMFQGLIQIYIPSGQSIANLREEFAQYCDDENIDGLLEPVKH